MKTILLPTDFSQNSLNAIQYAISMFGNRMNFILVNAFHPSVSLEEYVTEQPELQTSSEEELQKFLKIAKKKFPGKKLKIETISKLGFPVQVIDKIARRKKVDLVVMGTKGASGINEVIMGSITSEAIKNLSCPVMAVPERAKFKIPKNIAFAADFKKIENKSSLNLLLDLAKKFNSEVLVLHINEKKNGVEKKDAFQKSKLESLFKKIPLIPFSVHEANPVKGIENFINSREVDILAMISRKHSLIEKIFNPSVTKKLAMHTKIPLLALQN